MVGLRVAILGLDSQSIRALVKLTEACAWPLLLGSTARVAQWKQLWCHLTLCDVGTHPSFDLCLGRNDPCLESFL